MEPFEFRVPFFDTDAMGVVHHANYLKYFEMARIHFMRQKGLDYSKMYTRGWHFPLVEARCRYRKTLKFDDIILIPVTAKFDGIRFKFQYEIRKKADNVIATTGFTDHVCVDNSLTRIEPPVEILKIFEANPKEK